MLSKFRIYNQLFIRILLVLLGFAVVFYLLNQGLFYSFVFVSFIVFLINIELYFYLKNAFLFYDKTINAILNNDFSADFSKHKSYKNYNRLFQLYHQLKEKQNEQVSKDIIYRSILNNIET